MQTLLLFTIVGSLVAGDIFMPVSLIAQATAPATKTAPATAASKTAPVKAAPATKAAARSTTKPGAAVAAKAGSKAAPVAAAVRDSADGAVAGALAPTGTVSLRAAPDGQAIGTVGPQSTLQAVAHDRGWVRVRTEGWVRETEVTATDPTQATISAADLRADPDGTRGKTVRWDIEVLALATADPLRKGLNPDEPYLLARGPGNESALLYIAVPPSLLALARTVASRAPVPVAIVATVRSGRSEPVGVPILDAQSLVKR